MVSQGWTKRQRKEGRKQPSETTIGSGITKTMVASYRVAGLQARILGRPGFLFQPLGRGTRLWETPTGQLIWRDFDALESGEYVVT